MGQLVRLIRLLRILAELGLCDRGLEVLLAHVSARPHTGCQCGGVLCGLYIQPRCDRWHN
jgi:hypothetical protein